MPPVSRVYVCNTATNLYKALLHLEAQRHTNVCNYLLFINTESAFDDYAARLSQLSQFDQYHVIPEIFHHSYIRSPLRRIRQKRDVILKRVHKELIGCPFLQNCPSQELAIFTARHPLSLALIYQRRNSFRLLEDGTGNYFELDPTLKHRLSWLLSDLFIFHQAIDVNRHLTAIELRHPELVPPSLSKRTHLFSLKQGIEKLSEEHRQHLIEFFTFNQAIDIGNRSNQLLLLTQPFSEIGLVSEAEKIAIYQRALDKYAEKHRVFVKPHPRERTDYTHAFRQSVNLLPQAFPVEILNLAAGFVFARGLTISSTALDECDFFKEKLFLGLNWDQRLSKHAKVHEAFR